MALQGLTMMLPSRLDCPLSLKTPNMGNTGRYREMRGSPGCGAILVSGGLCIYGVPSASLCYDRRQRPDGSFRGGP